jgi:hypothetical protein
MSRYIDADALKANCDIMVGNTTIGRRDYVMFHEIDSAPSIDIVRCRECKWWNCEMSGCKRNPSVVAWRADDFCSYGERNGDE